MSKERMPLLHRLRDYKPLHNTSGSIRDEKDIQGLTLGITKEVESLRNFSLVPGARKTPGEMQRFDKLDMSAMLKLESSLDRQWPSRQVLPEGTRVAFTCEMKAKKKYQSDAGLEIEHLNKGEELRPKRVWGIGQQDSSPSSWALFNTTRNAVAQEEIIDSAHLPVHTPTIKRKEYHSRILFPPKSKTHQFFLTTFTAPTKCQQCTSLMVGLIRQGCVCDACGFSCHTACVEKAPRACPVPSQQKKGPLCLDPRKGVGTAYEGHVWIPKEAGLKKGWQRALAIVCDFKLFLYNTNEEEVSESSAVVSHVIDMR
ncbi:PREDICTED: serine/threonine-protein kinase MRCK alpha-like [Galeopterus variegatus]|uniref:Serine/threonine-protein kinase MRCK alpha-like n=1 Tax=Galeopterus variegatus TaxID=482537 RepID=A0ABM0SE57_GALVR|nr:PREDICTED: serine/threonine-protein kinase MRCK alpha-like [Galeopterus variegatus]